MIFPIRVQNCVQIGLCSSQLMPLRKLEAKIRFVAALFFAYNDFPYYPAIPFCPGFPYTRTFVWCVRACVRERVRACVRA